MVSRLSFVIAGRCAEDTDAGSFLLQPGDLLLKSRLEVHENRMSERGLSVLTIEPRDDKSAEFADEIDCRGWSLNRSIEDLRLGVAFWQALDSKCTNSVDTIAMDMVARATHIDQPRRQAPQWLVDIHADLMDVSFSQLSIQKRAQDAGVHPAHASRLFKACFGTTFTKHAQNHAIRRALNYVSLGRELSQVAVAAGFFDQSHFARVLRQEVGIKPAQLRRLYG